MQLVTPACPGIDLRSGPGWEVARRTGPPGLPGVLGYRGFRIEAPSARARLETPDGCVYLVLGFAEPLTLLHGPEHTPVQHTSLLSGPQQQAGLGTHHGGIHGIEIAFAPWTAATLFRLPMHQLTDSVVVPEQLSLPWLARLHRSLAAADTWCRAFAQLDRTLAARVGEPPAGAAEIRQVWRHMHRRTGRTTVQELAEATGWSTRRLQQRFREQIGLTPKAAVRIMRLQHALHLLQTSASLSHVAHLCGYFDQSHLNRDFRLLTGGSPLDFTAGRSAHASGPPLARATGTQASSTRAVAA
ncbi:helix-turn-helix transcriptional regulator [Streptomyces sp. TBY4]|uniref:helix-turn-helix domain-containing protein n=1 Tax=Streptomyces sp. TBY4 TaxID=2962030 RepID=UPI0020B88764|nr:helix-turn-helix transcriptional regulator [Streptomyces sp. TBY4]MCP3758000.1 helix-turn-helix transcriptional regulator [Streptomyces sp. TBY4]